MSRIILSLLSTLAVVDVAAAWGDAATTCYYPNSEIVNYYDYIPCNANTGAKSMCCGLNRTVPYTPGVTGVLFRDTCLPNGLCQHLNVKSDGKTYYEYWRQSCNNANWEGCLKDVCGDVVDDNTQLTPCPLPEEGNTWNTTRWCCGTNNTACCNSWDTHRNAVKLDLDLAQRGKNETQPVDNSNNSNNNTTSSNNSTCSSNSSTDQPTCKSDGGLSTGAAVGAIVGTAVAAGLIMFALGFFVSSRKNKKVEHQYQQPPTIYEAPAYQAAPPMAMPQDPKATQRWEVPGHQPHAHELSSH